MSNSDTVLVFGKNGQVGGNIVKLLESQKTHFRATDMDEADLTDLEELIHSEKPKWVINCAAYTAVDRAEEEVELAHSLNVLAPKTMAECCSKMSAKFIHYSTDYVFSGEAGEPYREDSEVCPRSVYGKTKLLGEQAVLAVLPESIILRTAWVYSKQGHNFVNTMLRLASECAEISVVDDQIGSPTLADDLAQVTMNILNKIDQAEVNHVGGIFHATGTGFVSWYEFCKEIFRISNISAVTVNPIQSSAYPSPAPRPAYAVLSNEKLLATYGEQLPDWRVSLRKCLSA